MDTSDIFMERDILADLSEWKASPFRKPLIIKGARQVGKTQVLKEFGRRHYDNVAYVSLEKIDARTPSEFTSFFQETLDPNRIVANLSLALGQPINPGTTLLVLDEIQDCPAAINSLKYFSEDAPQFHVACAGSLLGVALNEDNSFPVGKVEFKTLYPMSFSEFLRAVGVGNLDTYAKTVVPNTTLSPLFIHKFEDSLRAFFSVGGMPEAVLRWKLTSDITQVDAVLSDLIDSYERDFAKHGGGSLFAKLSQVWSSIPAQLARENKKFLFGLVREGARAREYDEAIIWLEKAGLIYRVSRSSKPGIPMSAYDESAFKIYVLDIGVLRRLARLDASVFAQKESLFTEFKGAFAENFVLQSLIPQLDVAPRYWANEKPRHEVDFLVQLGNKIIPCEVKAGTNVKSPSLKYYANNYPEATSIRTRFSLCDLLLNDDVLNIPLYLSDQATRLIKESIRLIEVQ